MPEGNFLPDKGQETISRNGWQRKNEQSLKKASICRILLMKNQEKKLNEVCTQSRTHSMWMIQVN